MHTEANCIFCKIVNNEIPSYKVYEDDAVVAFLDISQVTKGHTLIIPKHHARNIYELPAGVARDVFQVVPTVANAIQKETGAIGMNILSNAEAIAGQTVYHFHIHLLPRYDETDGFDAKWETHQDDYSADDMHEIATRIQAQL